jgi:hypothetical protein
MWFFQPAVALAMPELPRLGNTTAIHDREFRYIVAAKRKHPLIPFQYEFLTFDESLRDRHVISSSVFTTGHSIKGAFK